MIGEGTIVTPWKAMYADPIDIRAGEPIVIGHEDPEWPGWRWCTDPRGKSGWTPSQYLDSSTILHDFTARELTIEQGDRVTLLHELNGWYWAKHDDGREGWIPATHIARRVEGAAPQ